MPRNKAEKTGTTRRGTVVIDPSSMAIGSPGFHANNFVHEGFHWHRHRMYATVRNWLYGEAFIACRNSKAKKANQNEMTSEELIEWQARYTTPRIQMPKEMFKKKAEEVMAQYPPGALENDEVLNAVVKALADFFIASRHSVRIRLEETGFLRQVYEINDLAQRRLTTLISAADAFREYRENQEFRAMVDAGAVRFVENRYIINDPRYIEQTRAKPRLTDYARSHLSECALLFVKRKNYARPVNGMAFRVDHKGMDEVSRFERKCNESSVLDRADEIRRMNESVKAKEKNMTPSTHHFTRSPAI